MRKPDVPHTQETSASSMRTSRPIVQPFHLKRMFLGHGALYSTRTEVEDCLGAYVCPGLARVAQELRDVIYYFKHCSLFVIGMMVCRNGLRGCPGRRRCAERVRGGRRAVRRRRSGLWLAMFGRECHRDAATGLAPPHDLTLLHDRPR